MMKAAWRGSLMAIFERLLSLGKVGLPHEKG
jgi:hypothetical protein